MKLTIVEVKRNEEKLSPAIQRVVDYLQGLKLGEVVTIESLAAATGTTVKYMQTCSWIFLKPYSRRHGKRRYYGSLATMKKFDKEITNGRE